jgi:plastocyanin
VTRTPHRARRLRAGLLAAALVTLSACGSDDDGDDAAAEDTPSVSQSTASETAPAAGGGATGSSAQEQPAGTIAVTSQDFSFDLPEEEMAAGEYTIELTNGGSATHDLVVERDGEDVGGTEQIGPGESSSVTVTLEPGEYVFYCSVGNHRSMGMEVTVTVT